MVVTSPRRRSFEVKEPPSWNVNPAEKYAPQIGNLPQIGVDFFKKLKPPPRSLSEFQDKNAAKNYHASFGSTIDGQKTQIIYNALRNPQLVRVQDLIRQR